MFKFLAFFLKNPNLKNAGGDLYRGACRILLLLLHDFPEFLAEHYFSICDVIPYNCIQLRNVVLSAFPVNVTLPDPYLPYNQLEAMPQMSTIPPVLSDFSSALQAGNLRADVDQILSSLSLSNTSISTIQDKLRARGSDEYKLSLVNSLVAYVGISSVAQAKARSGSPLFNASDPGVLFLQLLTSGLDPEGKVTL
jgi:CCR4-NOT transcription complex subunit 1